VKKFTPNSILTEIENRPKTTFFSFQPNETGPFSLTPFLIALHAAVQLRCIFFQNFAQNEMGDFL
jgi:hypothetical protein